MRAARNNLWPPEPILDFFIPPEVGILFPFPHSLQSCSPDLLAEVLELSTLEEICYIPEIVAKYSKVHVKLVTLSHLFS